MNTYGSGRKRRRLERPRDARSELIKQTEPFEAVASSKVCFSAFQEPNQQQHPFLRKMNPISPSRRRRRCRHLFNLENRRDDSTKKNFFRLLSPLSDRSRADRQTTNSIQPTDERASCQCERVITPTKRRERGETERDQPVCGPASSSRACGTAAAGRTTGCVYQDGTGGQSRVRETGRACVR